MKFYRDNAQTPSGPRKRARRILLFLPVLLFSYLVLLGDNGLFKVWHHDRRIVALAQEIEQIKVANSQMEKEIAALESDLKTIERVARERYGMVKEKETVYMVYPNSPNAARQREP